MPRYNTLRQAIAVSLSSAAITLAVGLPAHADSDPYTILKVDGQAISSEQAQDAWKALFPEGVAPKFEGFDEEVRQNVLRGLVSETLLHNEAVAKGVADRASVKQRLENLKKQIVIQSYIEELSESFVTEKAIRNAYAEYKKKAASEQEVRARHILVAQEGEAKKITAQLADGKDFAALAKASSIDKGSAQRGGDLGFFTREKMVKPFADTAFGLKKGEISKPVRSDFGWHIIKLEERRPVTVQPFEEMQETLKAQIRGKGVEQYVGQLIDKASVEYFAPNGDTKKLELKP